MVENKVRLLRDQRGITLRQLSEETGISRSQLSRIENRECLPSIEEAYDIAHALKADIKEVFIYTHIEKPQP